MWDWTIAVSIMLATMFFGWWLQRREAMQITRMIGEVTKTIEEGNNRVTRLIEDGNKRLELILLELGKDIRDVKASLGG